MAVARSRLAERQTEDEAIGDVAQLADVAGPGQPHQLVHDAVGNAAQRPFVARRRLQEEMAEEHRDVLAPLAQRRQLEDDDAQPVVEVAPERLVGGRSEKIRFRRRDDAAAHRVEFVRAEPLEVALLQAAEQLDLQADGHRFDFVQEQGASGGMLHLADTPTGGAGERAGLVAEHFALEQRLRDAAAIDRRKMAIAALAVVVQAAGDQLLARARLARDQHVGVGRGDVENDPAQVRHRGRTADQLGFDRHQSRQLAAQRIHFQRQAAGLQGAPDRLVQAVGRERLLDEIVGPETHRLHRHRDIAVAGDDDDRKVGIDPLGPLEQRHAVDPRQADVGHEDAAKSRRHRRQGLLGRGEGPDRAAGELERLGAPETNGRVVFDEEDDGIVMHRQPPGA